MLSLGRLAVNRSTIASRLVIASTSALPSCSSACVQRRNISSKDVFNSEVPSGFSIPDVPLPPSPTRSIAELVESGESVLEEMGLWSWWKPSSYFRWALESIHVHLDVPWWSSIVCTTVLLRLALIGVPIMSQRLVAKQSQYKKELDAFRTRIEDARREGDNLAVQQVLLEQREFYKSKDIKIGRQFLIMLTNGGIFMTQFLAIRKMTAVNYPGLSTGGTLWFTDLTVCDPYWALPVISAATMALVMRVGIESGSSADQMTPWMRLGMLYGLPAVILFSSSQFATGLCVYWCASNVVSLFYAGFFKIPAVRKVLKIPDMVKSDATRSSALAEVWKNHKNKKQAQPTLSDLRIEDAKRFKKAGRGKPQV